MKRALTQDDLALWQRYVDTYNQVSDLYKELYRSCGSFADMPIVELVRRGLADRKEMYIALEIAEGLERGAKKQLFDALFIVAQEIYMERPTNRAERIILSLPKEWVLERMEEKVLPLLLAEEPDISSGLLALCLAVDRDLTRRLAEKALGNPDEYSQDVGSHFLRLAKGESND